MKTFLLSAMVFVSAFGAFGQPPAAPASVAPRVALADTNTSGADADREHDAFWAAWRAPAPDGLTRTNRGYWQWQDKVLKKFAEDAQAFAKKYPKDPRRWDGLIQSGYTAPWFITGFRPEFDDQPREANLIVDTNALAAFKESILKFNYEAVLSEDATANQRRGALAWMFDQEAFSARKAGTTPNFARFQALVDEVIKKLPVDRGVGVVAVYLGALEQTAPEKAMAFESSLANSPMGTALKDLVAKEEQARVQEKVAMAQRVADIGTNRFTAADGREVDLTKMRGKVVLVDFWATWCGPCVHELPNVVANYQKYHDKGFEVVGISLENASLTGGETEEGKTAKLAAAKQKMLDFTVKNNMPWPQYYDGRYWANVFAVKYGIQAIPATFLLDKTGKVASIEARGPDLEPAIRRLLGI